MVIINDNYLSLHCFNIQTGAVIRSIDLNPMNYEPDSARNYWSMEGNNLYFIGKEEANNQLVFYSLDLTKGKISWKKPLGNQTKIKIRLGGQYFFITQRDRLLIVNRKNGSEIKNIIIPYEFEISEILQDLVIINPINQTDAPGEYALALRWK
jgi:hypothetical protein